MDFSELKKRIGHILQLAKIVKKEKYYSSKLKHTIEISIYEALFEEYNSSIFNISIVEDSDSFRIYAEVTGEQGKFTINGVQMAVFLQNEDEPIRKIYTINPDTFLGFEVVECYYPINLSQVIGIKIGPKFYKL